VDVREADAGRGDGDPYLSRAGLRLRYFLNRERGGPNVESACEHGLSFDKRLCVSGVCPDFPEVIPGD
jgi:hypothetical protein